MRACSVVLRHHVCAFEQQPYMPYHETSPPISRVEIRRAGTRETPWLNSGDKRGSPCASTDCGPAGRENCFESHRPRRPAAGAAAAVRSAHRVRLNLLHRFHVSRSSQRRDHHPVAASDSPRVFAPPYNICASFDSDLETCAQSLPMSTQVGRLRANYASRAQSDVLTAFSTATASALSLSVSLDLFTVLLCSKCTGARCV